MRLRRWSVNFYTCVTRVVCLFLMFQNFGKRRDCQVSLVAVFEGMAPASFRTCRSHAESGLRGMVGDALLMRYSPPTHDVPTFSRIERQQA